MDDRKIMAGQTQYQPEPDSVDLNSRRVLRQFYHQWAFGKNAVAFERGYRHAALNIADHRRGGGAYDDGWNAAKSGVSGV